MSEWSQGDVTANGICLHFYRTGGGNKPALVLAHGLSDNGLCWTPVAQALEDEYDIIMYDARGHGLSDAPEGDVYSYAHHADDLAGLVEALGLRQPAMLGHSMGAVTIATAAATDPHLACCVLLEDPPLWGKDFAIPSIEERKAHLERSRAKTVADKQRACEELIAESRAEHPTWPEAERGPWAEAKLQLSPDALDLLTARHSPWQETFARLAIPVLLVTGDAERGGIVTPEVAAEAASLWRVGRVAHIPGTGHNIRRENFTEYLTVVRAFLREYGSGV